MPISKAKTLPLYYNRNKFSLSLALKVQTCILSLKTQQCHIFRNQKHFILNRSVKWHFIIGYFCLIFYFKIFGEFLHTVYNISHMQTCISYHSIIWCFYTLRCTQDRQLPPMLLPPSRCHKQTFTVWLIRTVHRRAANFHLEKVDWTLLLSPELFFSATNITSFIKSIDSA
jgi:hypothetical protein